MIITSNSSKPATPPDISYHAKEPPNAMDELEAQLDGMDEDMVRVRTAAYFQSFMLIGMSVFLLVIMLVLKTM